MHRRGAQRREAAAQAVVSGRSKDGLSWDCSLGLRELAGRKPAVGPRGLGPGGIEAEKSRNNAPAEPVGLVRLQPAHPGPPAIGSWGLGCSRN